MHCIWKEMLCLGHKKQTCNEMVLPILYVIMYFLKTRLQNELILLPELDDKLHFSFQVEAFYFIMCFSNSDPQNTGIFFSGTHSIVV